MTPVVGPPGSQFIIRDSLGRMRGGLCSPTDGCNRVSFFTGGPLNGLVALGVVSDDGTTLVGTVPGQTDPQVYNVFVFDTPDGPDSLYGPLTFTVDL